MLLKVSVVG